MFTGIITDYTDEAGVGVIKTADKDRYVFTRVDWMSPDSAPEPGMDVMFDPAGLMALRVLPLSY